VAINEYKARPNLAAGFFSGWNMSEVSLPKEALPETLADWLALLERRHPKSIDMGLQRVSQVRDRLQLKFDCPVFMVAGTNGKGSTCAMLESILMRAGYRTGLYIKPHFLDFNERARIDGVAADDDRLMASFRAVEAARETVSLTYFEFTTLAIMHLLSGAGLEAVILEVGLGGRLDAVNVIDADVAIVTSIDIDHADYLGDTRELIGAEKAGIFRAGKPAICSDPVAPQSLIDYAGQVGADLWLLGRDFNYSGDKQQWNYGGRQIRRNALGYPTLRGANQLLNASAALAALESIRDILPVSAQDVRNGLAMMELPGRFQVMPGQPLVILDVAHNPHAAATLAQNLDNMGFHPYTYAVFGAMQDKDIAAIVAHMKGRIDHWLVCSLPGERAASTEMLTNILQSAGFSDQTGPDAEMTIRSYQTPAQAYTNALERAAENDRILVFGSFLTVADVMRARKSGLN
jgi:dihydrofolate synthase/folylpolyglutamate synthase